MSGSSFPVDAHVHFHRGFDRGRFLGAAARNFAAATGHGPPGVLMLTECAGVRYFESWCRSAGTPSPDGWTLERTAEPNSLLAHRGARPELLLVAGRQVVTGPGIELLALGTDADLPDGRELSESLDEVRNAGGLPVLPWGAGKWWFRRGRLIDGLVAAAEPGDFWLGDNGGRPGAFPAPPQFARARSRGIAVLPGTDPLPLPGEVERAGSFGFELTGELDPARPAAQVLRRLREPGCLPRPYGRLRPIHAFVATQIALRLRRP